MRGTVLSKKEHIIQYSRCLIVIACISLSLFALTSVAFASSLTSDEQTRHTLNGLTTDGLTATGSERLTADHMGVAAGAPSDTTPVIRAGAAVFGAARGNDGDAPAQVGFSETGGADRGDRSDLEPASYALAMSEPGAGNGIDGAGGVVPPGVYMIGAEPDTPYTFSARGISSDHAGTYEPLVYAMEVDCNGRLITQHILNFGGCYDWVEKEIAFTTSYTTREFYIHANTWECDGTFQVEDVVLEVCEVPLPGVTDLGHAVSWEWINWTWVNPDVVGFSYVMVYLSGVWQVNTSGSFYNATGLNSGECYEIGVRTVGVGGGVSDVWVNQTGETAGSGGEFVVRASDGLEFSLTDGGAVSGVAIDGVELPMLSVPGGFSFRELSTTLDIPLEGAVEKNYDGSITQYVTSSDIAFRFDYIPRDRYIEVHGDIQDLRDVDRAIQVQYVLPVDATGWQWGDYIRKSREIDSGVRYENVYKIGEVRTQNAYPFTFVGEDTQGLSLAVPMDVPRIYRIGYGTSSGGYSLEYDFGLANCTDKIGHGHANFTFIMYKVNEPEWGFRAVAKKYYELYPEFFVKRNEREGLWVRHDTSDIPNASDFGFAFDGSHYHSIPRRVYDHQHGLYPIQYIEPWGWWRSFGDNSTEPSYDEKIAAPMDDYNNVTGMWRDVLPIKFVAEAVLNTAPYDENGKQYLNHPYFWQNWGWGDWTQNYPGNPDPDIPSPNLYDMSYAKYLRSNECGTYVCNWTLGTNCSINTAAHSGNYACKIEIPGTSSMRSGIIVTDYIQAAPLTEYKSSVWGKTLNCDGALYPCAAVTEYDIDKTCITQENLCFDFGTSDWTQKSTAFTTTADTAYIRVYANIWNGYGTFWFDDIELYKTGSDDNLVENPGFELIHDASDYPCTGFHVDSLRTDYCWAEFENYRRDRWKYTDYPIVFSYHTKQPVLLGAISQYDYLAPLHENMTGVGGRVDANIFSTGYSFYGHLIDVVGSEVWDTQMDDDEASLRRTMSYQKTNANLLQWTQHGNDVITYNEMNTYMNNQMFYGMFPSIMIVTQDEGTYEYSTYWDNATLYERDRDLFKRYIPIIRNISAAGWEPIPYATCDNPHIRFERYGNLADDLYYTVTSYDFTTESDVLSVDLSKLGFGGTVVEVIELVTNRTSTQKVEAGRVHIVIPELHPHDTLVYKINP